MLHIGYQEARRLLGENPEEGPVVQCMRWAYRMPDETLRIIHIRDWHDADDPEQRSHLRQFGVHCLAAGEGAAFAFPEPPDHSKEISVINSLSLNDVLKTPLAALLAPFSRQQVRFGIIGVWTDAKVSFLAYELRTRFPHAEIATCSALTASSSRIQHFIALEQLQKILDVKVFHTVGGFTEFLGDTDSCLPSTTFGGHVDISVDRPLIEEDGILLRHLFRHCRSVDARQLDGGFSGNVVLGATSVDALGHREVPHVVKIGPRELIGKERTAFEQIESVLGNSAPRVADFCDYGSRGAIKYRYASMTGAKAVTFQKYFGSGCSQDRIGAILNTVFSEQLGRLYHAGQSQKCDLLTYYAFDPKWAPSVRSAVAALGVGEDRVECRITPTVAVPNLINFYEHDLGTLRNRAPDYAPFSYVHGDLNGANILIDDHENVWLIDFFHTHYGHALKDLIKLENDLLYIYTAVDSEREFRSAIAVSNLLLSIGDLASPMPEPDGLDPDSPQFLRCYETLCLLHSLYPSIVRTEREPIQYFIGHMRYAAHALSFPESSFWQKKWALYTASHCSRMIVDYYNNSRNLRIDWLPERYTDPGQLGLTLLPGRRDKGRIMEHDIAVLKDSGVTHVITLATTQELHDYGVGTLLSAYAEAGLVNRHMPVLDQKVPDREDMERLIQWMAAELSGGARMVVHCVGGLGRAGTVAACYLRDRQCTDAEALAIVRQSRSQRAVETRIQEDFVALFR
jgi:protein-tyrosine phosphatase